MQRGTEPDPAIHRHSVHQMRQQLDEAGEEIEQPIDQNTADQHQRRVVELLGIALARLNGRGGLSKTTEQDGTEPSETSGDSAASRLESSPDSGLTVHNG
ncbi:hypothetical protein [Rhodopirellula halodulae]|uniref:hypothetical protein n=1 Tax=Rhodopirellula halodulae TaxID=2894198 RepID=UPI001E4B6B69|nr:hypothetical protein [Rhodopirellula sp. JC737]MCC9654670.1 hypothetical protein [Rhodopirellula sp. JC737]